MDGPSCARCRQALRASPAPATCPACRAAHCAACAALPGTCARPGCGGAFPPGPIPPLGVLARSAAGWEDASRAAGAVLVLLPGPRAARERTEAAQVVGELLRAGPEDGQRRLASGHPEPLVRWAEAGAAEGGATRLAGVGLPACVLPAAAVAAPLLAFEVASLVPGDPWRFRDAAGQERALAAAAPRLVLGADLIEVRRAAGVGEPARTATERRLVEGLGVVSPGEERPLLLRARAMRGVPGLPAAAPLARRLAVILGQLAAPPGRGLVLEGARAPALLATRSAPPPGEEGEEVRDNLPAVLLAARLLAGAWRAGRLPKELPAIAAAAW